MVAGVAASNCSTGGDASTEVAALSGFLTAMLLMAGGWLSWHWWKRNGSGFSTFGGVFLLRESGQPPVLPGADECAFHCFMSHTWKTGQDQVAVIKRQLNAMLTQPRMCVMQSRTPHLWLVLLLLYCGSTLRSFLDVDDLDDINKIEQYVRDSATVLCFMSKGYFLSRPCNAELHFACKFDKPLLLVHEASTQHGGAELSVIEHECPPALHEQVFGRVANGSGSADVIAWRRTREYQACALLRISEAMLRGMAAATAQPRLSRQVTRIDTLRACLSAPRLKSVPQRLPEEKEKQSEGSGCGTVSIGSGHASDAKWRARTSKEEKGGSGVLPTLRLGGASSACALYLPGSITEQPVLLTRTTLLLVSEANEGGTRRRIELATLLLGWLSLLSAVAPRCLRVLGLW